MCKRQTALLAVLLLALTGTAIAFHGNPSPVNWISGGDPIVLMQGQTYDWKARFCIESHNELQISNACWSATPTLAPFLGSTCDSLV